MARSAASRYEKSPKIADKEEKKAEADVKKTGADKDGPGNKAEPDPGPTPDRDAGTEDVTVNSDAMSGMQPHAKALFDMKGRHVRENRDMLKRHMAEMRRVNVDHGMDMGEEGAEPEDKKA